MRIGIDARFFGTIGKGLGRYTQKLLENLEEIPAQGGPVSGSDNQYYVFLRRENWNEYQPKKVNFTKVLADIPWYGLREQIFFPRLLKKFYLDLVHFPHFNVPYSYRGNFIVTIHDLILFHYPTVRASTLSPWIYSLKKAAYHVVIRNAVRNAKKIIAVSEHTREDILKHFHVPPEKITVTYESADFEKVSSPVRPADETLKIYGIMKPYVMYVGNAYPHKNLEKLVLVFKEISKTHSHLNLVLIGKEDYFYARLKKFVAKRGIRNVVFADFVPDVDLKTIYREALAYIFPSLYEGFGLPPLEAMAHGVPVVSSNASCMPEILGDAAIYFDPKAATEMKDVIEKAISDNGLRSKLITQGREQLKKYSWKKMAAETLEIYKSCF